MSPSEKPGAGLAITVTCRCRDTRLICVAPAPCSISTTSLSRTGRPVTEGTVSSDIDFASAR